MLPGDLAPLLNTNQMTTRTYSKRTPTTTATSFITSLSEETVRDLDTGTHDELDDIMMEESSFDKENQRNSGTTTISFAF